MSERLDRIESIIESNARAIEAMGDRHAEINNTLDRTAEQQAINTRDIDALVEGISGIATELREVSERLSESTRNSNQRTEENAQRFDILLNDMRADRQRGEQENQLNAQRFNTLLDEMRADRQRATQESQLNAQRFDTLSNEMRANQQRAAQESQLNTQRFDTLSNEMRADRQIANERHTATQEILQSLLVELTRTNRRVDRLEQAG